MSIKMNVIKGDITKLNCTAIVNAANHTLLGGGGVDGAIHRGAGKALLEECKTLNGCKTGQAKITKGYNLIAKYVIHTVGPVFSGSKKDEKDLFSCYFCCLSVAKQNNIHSIAFPGISTGVYGYPQEQASVISLKAISAWQKENQDYNIDITFCCFSDSAFLIYKNLLSKPPCI